MLNKSFKSRLIAYFKLLWICFVITSCSTTPSVNPSIFQESFQHPQQESLLPGIDPYQFPEHHLNTLEKHNATFQTALLSLENTKIALFNAQAAQLPSASVAVNGTRSKQSGLNLFPVPRDTFQINFDSAFDFDPFGRLSALKDAAKENYQAAQYDLEALKRTLQSLYITSYDRIGITQQRLKWLQKKYDLYTKMIQAQHIGYVHGLIPFSNKLETQRLLHQTEVELNTEKLVFQEAKANYLSLLGDSNSFTPEDFNFTPIAFMPENTAIPIRVLDQRPDLIGLIKSVNAANHSKDASFAALYPNISFSFTAQRLTTDISELFARGDFIRNFTAALSQFIFDGGTRFNAIEEAKNNVKIAQITYKQAVLEAVNDLESHFQSVISLQKNIDALRKQQESLAQQIKASKIEYENGQLSISNYLRIQIQEIDIKNALLMAQQNHKARYIELLEATAQPIITSYKTAHKAN